MKQVEKQFKVGKVALVGRPNVGKSSLLNELLGRKVAAVSPRAQTTMNQILAVYEDDRGQIFFMDTPGLYKTKGARQLVNRKMTSSLLEADVVVYVVDHTRAIGKEEADILESLRKVAKPVVMVLNKVDVEVPDFTDEYLSATMDWRADMTKVSATTRWNLNTVIDLVFSHLPEGERNNLVDEFVTPLLSQSSVQYLEELIREKIYLFTEQEVPYQTSTKVTEVKHSQDREWMKVRAEISLTNERYKPMLIGRQGKKIAEIRNAVRKELEVATGKKVAVNLKVMG